MVKYSTLLKINSFHIFDPETRLFYQFIGSRGSRSNGSATEMSSHKYDSRLVD
jgi:hypothetical protein